MIMMSIAIQTIKDGFLIVWDVFLTCNTMVAV
jgi:hypothetical protein